MDFLKLNISGSIIQGPFSGKRLWFYLTGLSILRYVCDISCYFLSSNVHVYSLSSLMNKVLDKLLESGDYVSSAINPQHELAVLDCGGSIHALRHTTAPLSHWNRVALKEDTSSPAKCLSQGMVLSSTGSLWSAEGIFTGIFLWNNIW